MEMLGNRYRFLGFCGNRGVDHRLEDAFRLIQGQSGDNCQDDAKERKP